MLREYFCVEIVNNYNACFSPLNSLSTLLAFTFI